MSANMLSRNRLIGGVVLIVVVWIVCGLGPGLFLSDWNTRSSFGDMFGAVTSLFSALAFGGLIYTVLLQRDELALQREELKMTREELKRTASAQEESSKALGQQIKMMAYAAQINGLAAQLESVNADMLANVNVKTIGELTAKMAGQGAVKSAQRTRKQYEDRLENSLNDLEFLLSGKPLDRPEGAA